MEANEYCEKLTEIRKVLDDMACDLETNGQGRIGETIDQARRLLLQAKLALKEVA